MSSVPRSPAARHHGGPNEPPSATAGCVGGAGLAAGIGAVFPRFGTVNITGNRETVVPSLTAFTVFSLGLFVFVLPVLVVGVPSTAAGVTTAIDVSPTAVPTAGALLTALSIGVVGWLTSRYAARTIDRYTL